MAKKILIIDDDLGILEALKLMLTEEGYMTETSQSPEYIFNLKSKDFPDLILLDVLLSGNDGRDICKKLKSEKSTRKIPVILISAAPKLEQSIREVKAEGFLTKPFEIDDLLNMVEKNIN